MNSTIGTGYEMPQDPLREAKTNSNLHGPLKDTSLRAEHLGVITHGSLNEGIEMKLDPGESVEDVVASTFVVIQGAKHDFFRMITDVEIEAANEQILLNPPDPSDDRPAATVATAFVDSVEGDRTGKVIDARDYA